jgi:predicted patatin/cPLA2 family phospholipase
VAEKNVNHLVNSVQQRYKNWKQIKRKIDEHAAARSSTAEEIRN